MTGLPGRTGPVLGALGAGALLAAALLAPAAQAAQPSTPNSPDAVSALRTQLRAGSLLAGHGVTRICGGTGHCLAQVVTTAPGSTTPLSTQAPVGYGPQDLAAAYRLPAAGVGAHGTIAIIDAGAYPSLEGDLATYRAQYGLPECDTQNDCLKVVNYTGGAPLAPATGATGKAEEEEVAFESSLDVDLASAACPGCKIIELQVPLADGFAGAPADVDRATTDFGTAVTTAVGLGATSVSISYGYPTDSVTDTGIPAKDLDRPGVAIVGSSGDSGYDGNFPSWPADLPTVTAVGGTSLYAQGTGYTQTAWNEAGTGCAADLPPAVGQPKSVAKNCAGHRAFADVSADADPATGLATFDTWAPYSNAPADWGISGGTSASAPFIAGLYARGGHLTGVHGPNTLYAHPKKGLTDITLGQVAPAAFCEEISAAGPVCVAGPGWDGPTGLGTPTGLSAF